VFFGRLPVEAFFKSIVVKKASTKQRRLAGCSWCLQ